jgi:threonyl-tRNA synthetase
LLLAGDKDVEAGAVSFRFGDRTQINGVPREQAFDAIAEWIERRENAVPTAELVNAVPAMSAGAKSQVAPT